MMNEMNLSLKNNPFELLWSTMLLYFEKNQIFYKNSKKIAH